MLRPVSGIKPEWRVIELREGAELSLRKPTLTRQAAELLERAARLRQDSSAASGAKGVALRLGSPGGLQGAMLCARLGSSRGQSSVMQIIGWASTIPPRPRQWTTCAMSGMHVILHGCGVSQS